MNALAAMGALGFTLLNTPVVEPTAEPPILLARRQGATAAGCSLVVDAPQPLLPQVESIGDLHPATYVERMVEQGFPTTDCVAESLREPVYVLGAYPFLR